MPLDRLTQITQSGITSGITLNNINVIGVVTATTFNVGTGGTIITTTNTGNVGLGTTNPRFKLEVGAVGASGTSLYVNGDAVITGNVSVAGTVTYEDVTNVDSIGIITARTGVRIDAGGLVVTAGVSTFTSGPVLIGSGSSTGTASQPLQVTGGAYVSGSVGIGTTNPSFATDIWVSGNSELGLRIYNNNSGTSASSMLRLGNDTNSDAAFLRLNSSGNTSVGGSDALVLGHGLNKPLVFSNAGLERARFNTGGNLGIGTTNPQAPLHVVGTGQTALLVTGNARVTGILTVGTSSLTFDGNANTITGLSTITGSSNFSKPSFAGISSTISDNAVDVFVYDTRKDSDGGAWRKRTQHTSWYNETLNTATRGSRRDFPAVAVIVAKTDTLTIYDGDDPDLPMWMVFEVNTDSLDLFINDSSSTLTSISALNGRIFAGSTRTGTTGNITGIDFIGDRGGMVYTSSSDIRTYNGGIGKRNDGLDNSAGTSNWFSSGPIVNRNVNDVAMTVLPNAPIDSATGLPVPTIAVATQGGISIITDSGTVYNLTPESDPAYANIKNFFSVGFDSNQKLFFTDTQTGDGYSQLIYLPNYNYNQSLSDTYSYLSGSYNYAWDSYIRIGVAQTGYWAPSNTVRLIKPSVATRDSIAIGYTGSGLGGDGLSLIGQQDNYLMNCGITTNFNTGWLHGYTQGAFLSDTSTTSVTGTELVTNGTFASGTTGWSSSNGGALSVVSGALRINANGNSYGGATQTLPTLVVGKTYVLSADIGTISNASAFTAIVRDSIGTLGATYPTSNQKTSIYFTARQASGTYILFESPNDSDAICDIDNVSVRIAESDRSVNNKGLAVYGTITKTAVATGADLVAYSGFSTSNYLEQPYNSSAAAFDFGTGDFCVMGWIKTTDSSTNVIMSKSPPSSITSPYFEFQMGGGSVTWVHTSGGGALSFGSINTGTWRHLVYVRSSGTGYGYKDGVLIGSHSNTGNYNHSNTDTLRFGYRQDGYSGAFLTGSLALWKISSSAPSADQIKKIYNDEKMLFQENSKATLYGSSSAVTALAYDDSTRLLYVGTSSGRSDFQGLERINNTTTAVTTAISASNGLVAEQ